MRYIPRGRVLSIFSRHLNGVETCSSSTDLVGVIRILREPATDFQFVCGGNFAGLTLPNADILTQFKLVR